MNDLAMSVLVLYSSTDSAGMLENTPEWCLGIRVFEEEGRQVVQLNVRASPWYSGI